MINEKVILPVGVEVGGIVHREVVLRPQKVRDSIEVLAEDERAAKDDSWLGLLLQARQIVSFGSLEPEQVTPELLLDMYDVDMQVLMGGAAKLRERLKTFRDENKEPAQDTTGAA